MSAATVLALASRLAADAEAEGVPPFIVTATSTEHTASITLFVADDDLTPALAAALGLTRRRTYEITNEPGMSRELFSAVIEDVEVSTHHVVSTDALVEAGAR